MKHSHSGIAVLSLVFVGAALAQGTAPPRSDSAGNKAEGVEQFSSVDTNKDGRISQAEARSHAALNSVFSTLDTDKDTYLSQAEFGKWKPGPERGGSTILPPGQNPQGEAPTPAPTMPQSPGGNTAPQSSSSSSGGVPQPPGAAQ